MLCTICGLIPLDGRQTQYCSKNCERKGWRDKNREKLLEGKRRYRQTNKEKIATYSKVYKSDVKHVTISVANNLKKMHTCLRCQTSNLLEIHHIKHQRLGGGRDDLNNLLVLCKPCHALWHKMFNNDYFKGYAKPGFYNKAPAYDLVDYEGRKYELPDNVISIIPSHLSSSPNNSR